ncbi:MAG TPA: pyridoxamine 5'-phosphate oxidase [Flavipsychrobacter sp.]|nr:pyridoxamine 5'-phosphate oxidase [Flavipsychrobacter sp.]
MSHSADIAAIRTDYRKAALDEVLAGDDALAFFSKWLDEAIVAQIDEVNAMTLATCDAAGKPHARIVLLKGLEDGGFVFYTNYGSDKGTQLASNPHAALVFFWKELERQVRVEGRIEKLEVSSSDAYFYSRPEGSRLGAWASPQSQVIPDRSVLDANYKKYREQFPDHIPRPPHWGGYRLVPQKIEFWQGRSSRMHDRIVFERDGVAWTKCRLAP